MRTQYSFSRTLSWLAACLWMARIGIGVSSGESEIRARTNAPSLNIGDLAPPLRVSHWVKGEPVKEFSRDKTYLVEFWATWCVPCRMQIPHLNELQKKFGDRGLVVIGVDVREDDRPKVEAFVAKMGAGMEYRIALDEGGKDGVMRRTWLDASGQEGIPSSVVIGRDGRVAWIGYGMDLRDSVIEAVVAGTYDVAKAGAKRAARLKYEASVNQAISTEDWDAVVAGQRGYQPLMDEEDWAGLSGVLFVENGLQARLGKKDPAGAQRWAGELADAYPRSVDLNATVAGMIADYPGLEPRDLKLARRLAARAMESAKAPHFGAVYTLAEVMARQGDKPGALDVLERGVRDIPDPDEKAMLRSQFDSLRFTVCAERKDTEGASRVAREATDRQPTDGRVQNDFAWRLVSAPGLSPRDTGLALKLATRALELTAQDEPAMRAMVLDTLAVAQFMSGKPEAAAENLEKAIALLVSQQDAESKGRLEQRLKDVRAGRLPEKLD